MKRFMILLAAITVSLILTTLPGWACPPGAVCVDGVVIANGVLTHGSNTTGGQSWIDNGKASFSVCDETQASGLAELKGKLSGSSYGNPFEVNSNSFSSLDLRAQINQGRDGTVSVSGAVGQLNFVGLVGPGYSANAGNRTEANLQGSMSGYRPWFDGNLQATGESAAKYTLLPNQAILTASTIGSAQGILDGAKGDPGISGLAVIGTLLINNDPNKSAQITTDGTARFSGNDPRFVYGGFDLKSFSSYLTGPNSIEVGGMIKGSSKLEK